MQIVRYIESSGTQYIDTGFTITPSNGTGIKIEVDAEFPTTTAEWAAHGTGNGVTNAIFVGLAKSNSVLAYGNGCSALVTPLNYPANTRATFTLDMSAGMYSVSDIGSVSFTPQTPSVNLNVYLFAYNGGNDAGCCSSKLYACRIYDNGTLVRDYIPCLDDNGVACLYDTVESKYYYNAGTGTFVAERINVVMSRIFKVVKPVKVTITGTGNSTSCYVTVNGAKYAAAASGLEVMGGDTITMAVQSGMSMYSSTSGSSITLTTA